MQPSGVASIDTMPPGPTRPEHATEKPSSSTNASWATTPAERISARIGRPIRSSSSGPLTQALASVAATQSATSSSSRSVSPTRGAVRSSSSTVPASAISAPRPLAVAVYSTVSALAVPGSSANTMAVAKKADPVTVVSFDQEVLVNVTP
jgi:hypothetical protein